MENVLNNKLAKSVQPFKSDALAIEDHIIFVSRTRIYHRQGMPHHNIRRSIARNPALLFEVENCSD